MTMQLKPKGKSTVGTGSGPAAQRRRIDEMRDEEPKRLLGFKIPMTEHKMVGVAAKMEGMSVKDFCMAEVMAKTNRVLKKHGITID